MESEEPIILNRPNWGYFRYLLDLYYAMGDYAVIYTDNRSPYHVIKVANCDITDGESNYQMAEFLLENKGRKIEGLVDIEYLYVGSCDGMFSQLLIKISDATDSITFQKARNVLDLDEGDKILMVRMELLPYLGLTHPNLSKEEMIDRVATAAYNIGTTTGITLTDLKPANYGFREDGSAAIFDFNIDELEFPPSQRAYKAMISSTALAHGALKPLIEPYENLY